MTIFAVDTIIVKEYEGQVNSNDGSLVNDGK